MSRTMMIITVVVVVWAVLFAIFMLLDKKRKDAQNSFSEENRDKALVHLYCKNIKIDNKPLSEADYTIGEYLQKIVALTSGLHTIEGIFESTDTVMGKTRNVKSEKVSFELDLEAGNKYTVGMYFNSAQENKDADKAILEIPLSLYRESDNIKAYIIAYKET